MAELDELKDIVKKHWLFILGRPNGQRAVLTGRDLKNLDFGGAATGSSSETSNSGFHIPPS